MLVESKQFEIITKEKYLKYEGFVGEKAKGFIYEAEAFVMTLKKLIRAKTNF